MRKHTKTKLATLPKLKRHVDESLLYIGNSVQTLHISLALAPDSSLLLKYSRVPCLIQVHHGLLQDQDFWVHDQGPCHVKLGFPHWKLN